VYHEEVDEGDRVRLTLNGKDDTLYGDVERVGYGTVSVEVGDLPNEWSDGLTGEVNVVELDGLEVNFGHSNGLVSLDFIEGVEELETVEG